MNYVFLDIDGVINSSRNHSNRVFFKDSLYFKNMYNSFKEQYPDTIFKFHDFSILDIDSILLLCRLSILTETKFVLISSWISIFHKNKSTYNYFNDLFNFFSEEQLSYFIGQTKSGVGGISRNNEVLNYIKCHLNKKDKFCIIDDSGDKHFDSLLPFTIAPNGRQGFTIDDYIKSCKVLDIPIKQDSDWLAWDCDMGNIISKEVNTPNFTKFYEKYID